LNRIGLRAQCSSPVLEVVMPIDVTRLHRLEAAHRALAAQSRGILLEMQEAERFASHCRGELTQAQLRSAATAGNMPRVVSAQTEGAELFKAQADQLDADIANLRKLAVDAPYQFEQMVSELSRTADPAAYTAAVVAAEARVATADRIADELRAKQTEIGTRVGKLAATIEAGRRWLLENGYGDGVLAA
jgi:hypothetical protein